MKLTTTEHKLFADFKSAMNEGIQKIAEASKLYVDAIDADPDIKIKFHEAFNGSIPLSAWSSFEKVGRGEMHFKLLFGGGKNGTFIKRLPYSDQESILNGTKLQMLTSNGDMLFVDAREVTKAQAQQLFSGENIRSLEQQKAFIEGLKTEAVIDTARAEVCTMPYVIGKGKITFKAGLTLTKREFKRISADFL